MKKLILSTFSVAVLAALGIGLLARPAQATEPKAKFASMKNAVLASARHQSSDRHTVEVHVEKGANGEIGSWMVVDGQLTEIQPGQSYTIDKGNARIVVGSNDLSSLSPEMRKRLEEAIQKARGNGQSGGHVESYSVNGQSTDRHTAQRMLDKAGIKLKMSIDLNENHYKSIAFGGDPNTLVLMPKSGLNQRYVVKLDPKSSFPKNIALEQNQNGKWSQVRRSNVALRKA